MPGNHAQVLLTGAALVLGCVGAWADEPKLQRFEFQSLHMGTEFKLLLYCADAEIASRAAEEAFERIARLDAILSDYDPNSELLRLCEQAGGPPVPVSAELFEVLEHAQQLVERSEGAFDVTIGPVVRLWRRARRQRELPDPERLADALALVGSDKMRLDPDARTVQLLKAGMRLDLGGIAKGYASDEALAVLQRLGISHALVAGAGDIALGGPPPGQDGWTIGIAPLDVADAPVEQFLILDNVAVSTSGDLEQYVEIEGVRYSHIVDPRTGLGLTRRSSVTVVAPDGLTADSLATAVSVLGPDRGLALVEQTEGASAWIVCRTEDRDTFAASKRFQEIPSRGWPEPTPPAEDHRNGNGSE